MINLHRKLFRLSALFAFAFALAIQGAVADTETKPDIVKPLKAGRLAISFAYQFELLDEALRRSVPKYGPYIEQAYTEPMAASRDQREAVAGELINILIADAGIKALDEGMIHIPIPLDKGLHGTRISFIMEGTQERLAAVKTLEDLRKFQIAQGAGWGDVKILEYNKIAVVTSPTYESLLAMLQRGRYDLFPRGAIEIGEEFESYRERIPGLAIERALVIHYPFPQYFYVSKSEPRLAERIAYGLKQMVEDGTFDAIFNKHFGATLAALKLDQRTIIELENPFLPDWAR